MDTATTTTTTLADELRTAATRLRCAIHSFPLNSTSESPCEHCGISAHNAWIAVVNQPFAQAVAAWLMDTATWWDATTAYGPDGDTTLYHATPECCFPVDECGCFHRALDVARALNGGAA